MKLRRREGGGVCTSACDGVKNLEECQYAFCGGGRSGSLTAGGCIHYRLWTLRTIYAVYQKAEQYNNESSSYRTAVEVEVL